MRAFPVKFLISYLSIPSPEISTLTHFAWVSRISLATHALTRSSTLLTQSGGLLWA